MFEETIKLTRKSWFKLFILYVLSHTFDALTVRNVTRSETATKIFYEGNCDGVCTGINAYVSQGKCECTCQYGMVYVMTEGKCINVDRGKAFVLSDTDNPSSRLLDLSLQDLQTGIKLQYCESQCTQNTGDCQLKLGGSQVDRNAWMNLWEDENDINFSIVKDGNENRLKINDATSDYEGLLMKIAISCNMPNNIKIESDVMFSMTGTFQVITDPTTTTTPTTTSATTTPDLTTLAPTTLLVTSLDDIATSKVSTPSLLTISKTIVKDSPESVDEIVSTTTYVVDSTQISITPLTVSISQTIIPNSISQSAGNITTSTLATNNNDRDSMLLLIIIVPTGFAILLTIVCLLFMFCRWKKRKHERKRPSEPVSLFQATTPVFLVNGDTLRAARSFDIPFSMISDPLYELPPDEKKFGTVKNLYAQIDKFLKKKKRSSIDGSLDDGYNTDDNYDYRRFAAFPSDLYSFPGSTISLNEPDYKIPEDIDENNIILQQLDLNKSNNLNKNRLEMKPQKKSLKGFTRSIKRQKDIDLISSDGDHEDGTYESADTYLKPPYKNKTFNQSEAVSDNEEHPYDTVGVVLNNELENNRTFPRRGSKRSRDLPNCNRSLDSIYDDPIIHNRYSLDSVYDDPHVILRNKQREISQKYSKVNKKIKATSSNTSIKERLESKESLVPKDLDDDEVAI